MKKYGQMIMLFVIGILVICMSIAESLVERILVAVLLLGCVLLIIVLDMNEHDKNKS